MKKFTKLAAVLAATTVISTATVFADVVAIGPKIGTQGIGIEGRAPVMENTYVRLGVNYFTYSKNFGNGNINYKGKLTLLSAPLMVDYHPFDNSGFRLSAGIAYNGNKVTIKATPSKDITIKGRTYTKDEIGSITGKVKLGNPVAALLTIGYDSSFVGQNPLSFAFEAGVMYTGSPKASVSATGRAANGPKQKQFLADLDSDANKNFKSKSYLKFFPVLSIGVKYSF